MKISIVIPVHNEEENIINLIESILKQSKKPEEIIFVDDFSKDKTAKIIKKYERKNKLIKYFNVKNLNISKNRNYGIKKSKNDWILCIDAGCTINKDYILSMEKKAKKFQKSMFFGSITKIPFKTNFEQAYSLMLERKYNKNYLPKGHGFFIKKELWKRIKGFNENILAAEDTDFIKKAEKVGQPPIIVKEAIVFWKPRKNFKEVKKQFTNYGFWDGRTFSIKKLQLKSKINVIFCLIFPLAIIYSFLYSIKKTNKINIFFILFYLNLIKMYSYSIGLIKGKMEYN